GRRFIPLARRDQSFSIRDCRTRSSISYLDGILVFGNDEKQKTGIRQQQEARSVEHLATCQKQEAGSRIFAPYSPPKKEKRDSNNHNN
ncbi:MAG: hypothetical protein K0M63_08530, partial [Weeksellaceae bacterium]|nr:hypothetical protein [Weeksellaceae bacterium]